MKKLIVASNNKHKIEEIKDILSKFPLNIVSLKEAGIDVDVDETGSTFMENSFIKASEIYNLAKDSMVLADDSGLSVEVLGGAPGVLSARFAGEHGNDKKNNQKLLELLKNYKPEERKAKFVCAMVLIKSSTEIVKVQGEVEGIIIDEERGHNGFGYDPLFYVPQFNKTFAEMLGSEKNSISHRSRALEKLTMELVNIL